jgi:hypothetical protein
MRKSANLKCIVRLWSNQLLYLIGWGVVLTSTSTSSTDIIVANSHMCKTTLHPATNGITLPQCSSNAYPLLTGK